jgi:hypothetical protein
MLCLTLPIAQTIVLQNCALSLVYTAILSTSLSCFDVRAFVSFVVSCDNFNKVHDVFLGRDVFDKCLETQNEGGIQNCVRRRCSESANKLCFSMVALFLASALYYYLCTIRFTLVSFCLLCLPFLAYVSLPMYYHGQM